MEVTLEQNTAFFVLDKTTVTSPLSYLGETSLKVYVRV